MAELPFRPDLEQLRRQARDLQAGLPEAARLSTAQRMLAHRYGFRSWAALKQRVERLRAVEDHARRFERTSARDFPVVVPLVDSQLVADGALIHPNPAVRRVCIQLLDHAVDERGVPVLTAALADPVPRVRRHAIHALTCARCKPRALEPDVVGPVLERARRDPNPQVRRAAVAALGHRTSRPDVDAALRTVAGTDTSPVVRETARRVLAAPRLNPYRRRRRGPTPA